MRRSCNQGFTLIEVMIVVAVVGILSAIAYPSYRDHIIRGQLVDATNGLASVRAEMERYFQDNRTYVSSGTFVSPCTNTSVSRSFNSFTVSCVTGTVTSTAYTLQATSTVSNVSGFVFTINQLDAKATTAAPSGWTTCSTAWIVKKGQPCT